MFEESGEHHTPTLPTPDISTTIAQYHNNEVTLEQLIDNMMEQQAPDPQARAALEITIQQKESAGIAKAAEILHEWGRGKSTYAIINAQRFVTEICTPDPMTQEQHRINTLATVFSDIKRTLRSENDVVTVLRCLQYADLAQSRIQHILAEPAEDIQSQWQSPNGLIELTGMVEGFTEHAVSLLNQKDLDGEQAWHAWQTIYRFRTHDKTGEAIADKDRVTRYIALDNLANATLHGDQSAFLQATTHLSQLTTKYPHHFN